MVKGRVRGIGSLLGELIDLVHPEMNVQELHLKYGLDLLVTGHAHYQLMYWSPAARRERKAVLDRTGLITGWLAWRGVGSYDCSDCSSPLGVPDCQSIPERRATVMLYFPALLFLGGFSC